MDKIIRVDLKVNGMNGMGILVKPVIYLTTMKLKYGFHKI